jgi:phosphate transport system ATP-binding protein
MLLLDETTSALDPISTRKIEELIAELKKGYTIVISTHNMQQAARVSGYTPLCTWARWSSSRIPDTLFTTPANVFGPHREQTEDCITGRYG